MLFRSHLGLGCSSEAEVLRKETAALVQTAPDLIVSNSTPVTAALKPLARAIPVVFLQVTSPKRAPC